MASGEPGVEIVPQLAAHAGDIVIDKPGKGACPGDIIGWTATADQVIAALDTPTRTI